MPRRILLPRICIALGFPETETLLAHARKEFDAGERFLEFRIDHLPAPEQGVAAIRRFLSRHPDCTILATCRRHQNSGKFNGSVEQQVRVLEAAIEAGADECVSNDDGHEFLCRIEDYGSVRDALEAKFGQPLSASIVWRAQNNVSVNDEAGETLVKLIDTLDDHDDVQRVYGNYELSDTLMEKLAG